MLSPEERAKAVVGELLTGFSPTLYLENKGVELVAAAIRKAVEAETERCGLIAAKAATGHWLSAAITRAIMGVSEKECIEASRLENPAVTETAPVTDLA